MKKYRFEIRLSIMLSAISAGLYGITYLLFNNMNGLEESLLSQLAFLPIYILIVMIILENITNRQEKNKMMSKLNVIIGAFFGELGREMLKSIAAFDKNNDKLQMNLCYRAEDFDKYFDRMNSFVIGYNVNITFEDKEFTELKASMKKNRDLLLNMMSNPNLMEHETFTEMLLAIFHLYQELDIRESIALDEDKIHVKEDVVRAYKLLIKEWLLYLKHLKESYPYLFSLEIRLNPFYK